MPVKISYQVNAAATRPFWLRWYPSRVKSPASPVVDAISDENIFVSVSEPVPSLIKALKL